jgi:hypothetical protein
MLVSMLACDDHAFITAAGYVGPLYRVDHDVSLLIPELWSRMKEHRAHPDDLLAKGCLERCADFEHEGRLIPASRLGYRITAKFMQIYGGRMFSDPDQVFTDDMLKPETAGLAGLRGFHREHRGSPPLGRRTLFPRRLDWNSPCPR